MKTPDSIAASAASKLKRNWAHSLVHLDGEDWPQSWRILPTTATNKSIAAMSTPALVTLTRRWLAMAAEHPGVSIDEQFWNVHGGQTLPQKVTVADVDTAAAVAAERDCPHRNWPTLLSIARVRQRRLREVNPGLPDDQMEYLPPLHD